jgi:hypothetical protein
VEWELSGHILTFIFGGERESLFKQEAAEETEVGPESSLLPLLPPVKLFVKAFGVSR